MKLRDQKKLLKAGFTIVSPVDFPTPCIKIKKGESCEWRTLRSFPTKVARNIELAELLKLSTVIED